MSQMCRRMQKIWPNRAGIKLMRASDLTYDYKVRQKLADRILLTQKWEFPHWKFACLPCWAKTCRKKGKTKQKKPCPRVAAAPCTRTGVRNSNLGLCFFIFKCCVSQLSVARFGQKFEGVMTSGQVKSFCLFGQQRAEKRNIWRWKNTNLNLNSGLWI